MEEKKDTNTISHSRKQTHTQAQKGIALLNARMTGTSTHTHTHQTPTKTQFRSLKHTRAHRWLKPGWRVNRRLFSQRCV